MHIARLLISALLVVFVAGPAAAYYDEDLEIEFVESTAWFTATSNGLGNVDQERGEALGWSSAEPTGSTGRTVAFFAPALIESFFTNLMGESPVTGMYARQSFLARGSVTGYLDNVVLDLYLIRPPTICPMAVSIDLAVDGEQVLDMEGIGHTTDVTTYTDGDYHVAAVALTDIHEALVARGIPGDETTEHQLELVVQQYPLCQEAIWSYGSAEAPSRVTFNLDPAGSSMRTYTRFDVTRPPPPSQ